MADTSSLTSNETLKNIFGDGMSFELPKELKPDAIIASAKKEGEAIKSYRAKESEVEKAQAAGAARSASELSAKYEPQFQRTPDFAPSEENKAALVGMFGLLGAIGAMGGGKSYGSALGAMNAMGGMLKGYQQGRKDLFEREKAEYDKHVQAVKSHNDEITKAYARAQNVAKTNLAKADADLKSTLRSMGADMEASKVEREGISKAYESHIKAMNAGANAYKQYASVIEKLQKTAGGFAGYSDAERKNLEKMKGQFLKLGNILGEDVKMIGSDEMKNISATAESAKQTKELADDLREKPWAAGLVGKTLSAVDKYIPSRYGKDAASKMNEIPSDVASTVQSDSSIFADVPEDQISEARLIQKRVLDIINARTKAVSNRFLVAELKMQKDVLDIAGMSGQTAANVYEGLAKRDVEGIRQFDPTQNQSIVGKISNYVGFGNKRAETKKKSVEERFKELVGQNMTEDDIYETLKKEGY